MKQFTLSQATEGLLPEKQTQHLSPYTVADYTNAVRGALFDPDDRRGSANGDYHTTPAHYRYNMV